MRTKEEDRERKRKKREDANEIGKLPRVKNPKRKAACKTSLLKFLITYCMEEGGFLQSPPSEKMYPIIERLQETVTHGGRTHVRLPRGFGKTSYLKGAIVYALAYGYRQFPVIVSAKIQDARTILEDIWNLLENGKTFAEDFPEIAYPIAHLDGILQRAAHQTYKGKRTKMQRTAERIVLPTIDKSASSGSLVVARGIKGAARGLLKGAIRPDLLLADDPQTDAVAKNPAMVQKYDELLEQSFLGLAGHSHTLAAFMTSTPIVPDDLSDIYAKKPNWKTYSYPLLISEPTCWRSDKDFWQDYFRIRQDSISVGEAEHVKANEFYTANREAMDDGAEVLNPSAFDAETELSALQHAMNLRFSNGENSFQAEYQLMPARVNEAFKLSAPLVASRVRQGAAQFWIPPETVFVCAATDLNPAVAFSTVMVAFAKDQTGFIPHYALFKSSPIPIADNMPEKMRERLITQALAAHAREIAGWCKTRGISLNKWGVDCGGKQWAAVNNFAKIARQTCGIGLMPMAGRAGRNWNPYVRSRITDPRNETVLCEDKTNGWRWLAWNSDYYKETAQKAWLGEVGTPGSLSLFDGQRHGEYAAQVAAEVLDYKVALSDGKVDYKWRMVGPHNDLGDATAMCYALAGAFGISASGYIPPPPKKSAIGRGGKPRYTFKRGKWK